VQAVMYGPLVLAGKFDPVSKEMLYGDYEPKPTDQHKVPEITADAANPTAWVKPDSKSLTFVAEGQSQPITLVPLYQIIPERYAVYWKVNNKTA
jgi:hypothetical protein